MPDQPKQPDPWSLRASDADRDKYLTLLGEAFAEGRLDASEYEERMSSALGAKTYRDLYPVLEDLPIDGARIPGPPIPSVGAAGQGPQGSYLPVAPPAGTASGLPTGLIPDNSVVSVFGSTSRKGPWVVPTQVQALAVFGDVTIDLTGAVLSGMDTELRCTSVFGSIKVIVPDALHVDVSGVGILGEFESKDKRKGQDKRRTPVPNAPRVRVTGVALLGSVEVRTVVPKGGQATVSVLNPPALPPGLQPPQVEGPPSP